MTGKIYKIVNDINNKVYVGKTALPLEKRFKQHCYDSIRDSMEHRPLYNAMNKYGIDCFHIVLIEECDLDILSEREQYWIGYYNGYTDGYNATIGGEGKFLYDYNLIKQRMIEGKTAGEIMDEFGCCRDTITAVSKLCGIKPRVQANQVVQAMEASKKCVYQYDKQMNYIQNFDSYSDAVRWLVDNGYTKTNSSGARGHIGEVVRGKRLSAYGFRWFGELQ